ncbi:unnamed protein product [Mucor hiemalis]
MDRYPIINIQLVQEEDEFGSEYNLSSLMRGIHILIEQYLDHNGYPPLDNGSLQTLPLPPPREGGADPTHLYFVEIQLMGSEGNPHTVETATTIRIPLSNDLYITYVEIVNPSGSEPRRVNFPLGKFIYPVDFESPVSVLTRHLYQGLSELERGTTGRTDAQYSAEVKSTLFCCVILISEAVRSEYVRAYITQRNACSFAIRDAPRLDKLAWTYFRPFLDWEKRVKGPTPEEADKFREQEIERINTLFGGFAQLFAYIVRERYLKELVKIRQLTITDSCKEFKNFDDTRKDDDDEQFPDYKKLDKEISKVTSSIKKYEQTYEPATSYEQMKNPPNEKRVFIKSEIILLSKDIDEHQKLFEVMTGKEPETDDFKNRIRDNYGINLFDDDMQEVAKIYRTEAEKSFYEKFKEYAAPGLRRNLVVRNVSLLSLKGLYLVLNQVKPILIKNLLAKLGAKTAAKIAAKKVPLLAVGFGLIFGIVRAVQGDWEGAAYEVASGAAGAIPGVGTAASGGIDAGIAYRDYATVQAKTEELTTAYSNAVVKVCVDITQRENKIANLVIQGEFEDIAQWRADPNSRFLKSYDD